MNILISTILTNNCIHYYGLRDKYGNHYSSGSVRYLVIIVLLRYLETIGKRLPEVLGKDRLVFDVGRTTTLKLNVRLKSDFYRKWIYQIIRSSETDLSFLARAKSSIFDCEILNRRR